MSNSVYDNSVINWLRSIILTWFIFYVTTICFNLMISLFLILIPIQQYSSLLWLIWKDAKSIINYWSLLFDDCSNFVKIISLIFEICLIDVCYLQMDNIFMISCQNLYSNYVLLRGKLVLFFDYYLLLMNLVYLKELWQMKYYFLNLFYYCWEEYQNLALYLLVFFDEIKIPRIL